MNVLLVTDDSRSDDWYRRQGGQTRGPRFELINEMNEFAGVRLFMMRTQSLLHHAGRVLQVSVRNSSVEEAARVDERIHDMNERERLDSLRKQGNSEGRYVNLNTLRG